MEQAWRIHEQGSGWIRWLVLSYGAPRKGRTKERTDASLNNWVKNNMKDYASNLTQSERLELSARSIIIPPDSIGQDERRVISTPPNGFKMPAMSRVREHDARLSAYGSSVNVHDEGAEDEDSDDEESALRDAAYAKRSDGLREHSFRLPSQRTRRDVSDTLASMGMTYGE